MVREPQKGYVEAKSLTGQPRSTAVVARGFTHGCAWPGVCVQKQKLSAGFVFVSSVL